MRVSDDRYSRDVRRHDLAVRLIQLEARTGLIQRWTGLSPARVRTLGHSYGPLTSDNTLARRRGPSPTKLETFLSTARARTEAAVLFGVFRMTGAAFDTRTRELATSVQDLRQRELLCDAYDAYRALNPDARFTFEHAMLLLNGVLRGKEISIGHCVDCDALIAYDALGAASRVCSFCSLDDDFTIEQGVGVPSTLRKVAEESAGYQPDLF